jgi:hypothetical protein
MKNNWRDCLRDLLRSSSLFFAVIGCACSYRLVAQFLLVALFVLPLSKSWGLQVTLGLTDSPGLNASQGRSLLHSKRTVAQKLMENTHSIVQRANHDELIVLDPQDNWEVEEASVETDCDSCLSCDPSANCNYHPSLMSWISHRARTIDYWSERRAGGRKNYLFDWSRADLWIGTTAFTNPASAFVNGSTKLNHVEGSFGFQEGFSFGSQLPSLLSGQVGSQVGMRFVQANLSGSDVSSTSRNQVFATAGLYRRVDYGIQAGVVVDYLHENWVYKSDLWQLRGELSFLFSPAHEIGFRFSDNGKLHRQPVALPTTNVNLTLRTLDTYRLFLRHRFGQQATSSAELQLGTTDIGGAVLGCQFDQPLKGQIGLSTAATYLIPKSGAAHPQTNESWNLSLALVWTPGRKFGTKRDYNRPLFEVAGNGSLLTSRQ